MQVTSTNDAPAWQGCHKGCIVLGTPFRLRLSNKFCQSLSVARSVHGRCVADSAVSLAERDRVEVKGLLHNPVTSTR